MSDQGKIHSMCQYFYNQSMRMHHDYILPAQDNLLYVIDDVSNCLDKHYAKKQQLLQQLAGVERDISDFEWKIKIATMSMTTLKFSVRCASRMSMK